MMKTNFNITEKQVTLELGRDLLFYKKVPTLVLHFQFLKFVISFA